MNKVKGAKWFIKMLNEAKDTDGFNDETIEILEGEIKTLLSSLEKEKERTDKAEKRLESERISVNALSLANQELEERVKELKISVQENWALWEEEWELKKKSQEQLRLAQEHSDKLGGIITSQNTKRLELEAKLDVKDYTSPNLLVEQLTERIKELGATLASIKANEP